jgi:hypothetical protein
MLANRIQQGANQGNAVDATIAQGLQQWLQV